MQIKTHPEDFYVEEIIKLKPKSNKVRLGPKKSKKIFLGPKKNGDYTYFWLIKKNWTTVRATREIARKCRVSFRRFKFAGTKDKVAVTKQAVSAFKVEPETLEKVKLKDIEIKIIGKGDKQISLGDLEGNKFEIIVRDLSAKDLKSLDKKVSVIKKTGFKNFFGPQRFGRGNTHLIGKELIKGDLEAAVKLIITFTSEKETEDSKKARKYANKNWKKWKDIIKVFPKYLGIEKAILNWLIKHPNDFAGAIREIPKPTRKLYVHAYQAWIFNKALGKIKVMKKELPVPGTDTKLGKDKFSLEIKKILKKENIKLNDFKCARMPEIASKGTNRVAIIKPKKFKVEKLLKNKIKIQFELPKGVYATVLLAGLFNGKV